MTRPRLDVLLIEDNPGDVRLIREMLAEAEVAVFRVEIVGRLADGLERLGGNGPDAVLLDLSLPDSQGLDSFRRVHEALPHVPVVVLSGHDDEDLAARAVQEGAQDYLVKGQVEAALLGRSVRYAVERARVEEQLRRQADELRKADRRKDEFLAILAHELRGPLAPILSGVEILARAEAEPEAARWARETVRRQVGNLARLLEDLLDVSRIVHGKITIEKEPVRLEDVVRAAAETAAPVLGRRDLHLSVSISDETEWLEADPVRLEQVLVNLLHNATAYSDPGGRIWLEAGAEGGEALLRVRDHGAGMEPELVRRAFEPFAQGSGTGEHSGGGLGLGLALVRSLVELHGGTVTAWSEGPGHGSEFEVRLPAGAGRKGATSEPGAGIPEVERGQPSASEGEKPKLRILVVDDNRDTAHGLALLLEQWGHEAAVAHDGPSGLKLAREHRPEVVLLDIGLPGMDGCAVARALRSDPATADAVLWAVTGYGRQVDERRSREAGFERHLKKPVPPSKLRRLLEEVGAARPLDR